MRYKLSPTYTFWHRLPLAIFLFLFLRISGAEVSILDKVWEYGSWAFALYNFVAFFLCFKVSAFLIKERRSIEYDNDYLYIIDLRTQQQQCVSLENLIRLNMRPVSKKFGAISYDKHTLTFKDQNNEVQKIGFYIRAANAHFWDFIQLVKSKNSNFEYKNWTNTFDIFD